MPSGDRTGPSGLGSRTGRAFGYCSGFDTPGYQKGAGGGYGRGMGGGRGMGRGMGRGRGFNAGWGFGYPTPRTGGQRNCPHEINKEEEISMLKSEMDALERTRKAIEKRLGELGKE
jgi:hypothetical protein